MLVSESSVADASIGGDTALSGVVVADGTAGSTASVVVFVKGVVSFVLLI